MLRRIRELASLRVNFAFETTLASRSFAPWLRRLVASGYAAYLVFLWLPSAEFAIERVTERVRGGGHSVPPDVVRRRYAAGLRNFFALYQPLVSGWVVYDSSGPEPRLVAEGLESHPLTVYDRGVWAVIRPHETP
jgi:predicted ABC-type ATPase